MSWVEKRWMEFSLWCPQNKKHDMKRLQCFCRTSLLLCRPIQANELFSKINNKKINILAKIRQAQSLVFCQKHSFHLLLEQYSHRWLYLVTFLWTSVSQWDLGLHSSSVPDRLLDLKSFSCKVKIFMFLFFKHAAGQTSAVEDSFKTAALMFFLTQALIRDYPTQPTHVRRVLSDLADP